MAAKKQAATSTGSFANIQKIWEKIFPSDWLALLAEHKPESQFRAKGGQIIGSCPFHEGDRGASFFVTPTKGIVKCFGDTCGKTFTNPVKFLSEILKMNYGDTILFIQKRFGLKGVLPAALVKEYQDYYIHQQHKKTVCNALVKCLIDAIGDPENPRHMYARPLIDWLLGTRNIDRASIPYLGIGIIPPILYLEQELGTDSPAYKWAREYFSKIYEGTSWLGQLAFFMYDEPDNIARIKIRKVAAHDFTWVDDPYDEALGKFRGFYGLNYFGSFFGRGADGTGANQVYVTEGEFDTMACINALVLSGKLDMICIATGGKGSQLDQRGGQGGLDCLIKLGIDTVCLIGDKDNGGKGFIQHTLGQRHSGDVNLRIMTWPDFDDEELLPPEQRITDPDEWVQKRGYADFSKYARTSANYQQPHEWAYNGAADEIERIPGDDLRRKTSTAMEWGLLLHHKIECKAFCDRIAEAFGLDGAILYREINASDESEAGFVERIMEILLEHFTLVGVEGVENGKRRMELWHKETRATVYCIVNDERSSETMLSAFFGTLPNFVREKIGAPSFVTNEGEDTKMGLEQQTLMYRNHVRSAIMQLNKGLPDLRSTVRKAQGLHYMGETEAEGHLSYMVNGRDVYKITHPNGKLCVQQLTGPSDNGVVFRVDPNHKWLTTVSNAEDLLAGQDVDLPQLYRDILKEMTIGWAFKYPELSAQFLAPHLMCLPYMSVFPRQTAIMLNAEASSGKSRFTAGLIGGTDFPKIQLIAASHLINVYTPAGIRQAMDGSSLCLCLEEFEDYGGNDAKSIIVRRVCEMYRDMISEGGVKITIGSTGGTPKTSYLRHPLACCSIHPLRDEASLSRFVTFELERQLDRPDPVNILVDAFGEARLRQMKHELAIGLLKHIPELVQAYKDIAKEFATGANLPAKVPSRFREALYPALAMQKFLGLDYKKFAMDFCSSRKEQLTRISSTSENEQVFEAVLSSPFYVNSEGGGSVSSKANVRSYIANVVQNDIEKINNTKCGVYYDYPTHSLVVHWIEAIQGVLSSAPKFGKEVSSNYLKEISQRSAHHVPSEKVLELKILDRVCKWMGPGIQLSHCSVFDVTHLYEAARTARVPDTTTVVALPTAAVKGPPVSKITTEGATETDPDKVQGDDEMKI